MNKSNEPLDKQFRHVINNISKKEERICAIDRVFMEERNFITYRPPPLSILSRTRRDYQASLDEYQERLKLIETDLKWLLSQNYQKFWCQSIYDESCQKMIDSYLKLAPRPHDILKLKNLPPQISELHNTVHKSVFLVCLRLSTYKESKEDYMNVEAYAKIIYNNYIFDIPKIFDLACLYKKNQLLPKMIENLFKAQDKYYDDFRLSVKDLLSAFEKGKQTIRKLFDLDSIYYSQASVSDRNETTYNKIKENIQPIIEQIYYLTDFSITLCDLTNVQPKVFKYLIDQKFEHHIKDMMENTVFYAEDILNKMIKESESTNETGSLIKIKLKSLKYQLAKLFKAIFESGSIKTLISNLDNPAFSQDQIRIQEQECVDYFVQICCDIMEEKRFLCYYEEKFSLSDQIGLIVQLTDNKIDEHQYKFLIENLKSSVLAHSRKRSVRARFVKSLTKSKVVKVDQSVASIAQTSASAIDAESSEESDALVQSVLDLLPGTDTNLIKKCLKYFDKNIEQVINAFLENNLPEFPKEDLKIDSCSGGIELDEDNDCVTSKVSKDFSELSLRRNIYDGDQFDVFQKKEVDTSNIYLGKKAEYENFDLDDRKNMDREFFQNYDQIMYERQCKELGIDPAGNDEYDDEYDDTYDENTNCDEIEPESFKPLNQKLGMKKRDQFENDDDEEEDVNQNQQMQNNFQKGPSTGRFDPRSSQQSSKQNQYDPRSNKVKNDDYQKQNSNPQVNRNKFNNDQRNPSNQFQNNNQRDSSNQFQNNNQRDNTFKSSDNKQQRPLPQRAPKGQRNFDPQSQQDRRPIKIDQSEKLSQKFKEKYNSKQVNKIENGADNSEGPEANLNTEWTQNQQMPGPPKTAEQIKRDRKWKNDHKNSHRKDQAAKKANFF